MANRRIFGYLKGFKKQLIVGPAFKLTEAVFELTIPLITASIIDVGAKNNDLPYVLTMGGVMVLLGLLGLVCALTCQYNAALASQGYGTVLRNELFSHINSLSAADIDKIGASRLITRVTNDVNQLQLAVAMLIRLVVRAPFLVIGAAVISVMIDLKLSLIFFAAIPFIILILYVVMTKSIPLYKGVQSRLDRISLITRENLSGSRVIRAFLGRKRETKRFTDASDELKNSAVKVGRLTALLNPVTYIIMNLAIIAIVWFGGHQVFDGALLQGEIIALVQYMTQILLALVVVADLVVTFTKAAASAKRVSEIFELSPTITEQNSEELRLDKAQPAIVFDDVSFSYGADGETALSRLSFTAKSGQTVGIIGGTGSGKSTLIKLASRLYEPTAGKVTVYGNDVSQYPLKQLHKIFGIVPQRAQLFSGTIRSNLCFGNENADDAALIKATELAQAADFINKLPEGFDSPVLAGGKNLSGGQRQRLTIARALALNPDILILDDSSSALDYKTDSELRRAIASMSDEMTVIIVSQRASSIKSADIILVLEDGELVGAGTHDELIKSCDIYSEICATQEGAAQEGAAQEGAAQEGAAQESAAADTNTSTAI